jgi:hypothetical protein
MVVEIPAKEGAPETQVGFPKFEDRLILVRATGKREAHQKSERADAELVDGTEVYSAFIGREWAAVLMKGGKSPVGEWHKQNPGKDVGDATVEEINDSWDNRDS